MNDLKITTPILMKISLIINKMGISQLIMKLNVETENEEADKKEIVKELISLIIDNLYKAEKEVIELISKIKDISYEEAEKEDVIEIIQKLLKNDKIKSFLKLS